MKPTTQDSKAPFTTAFLVLFVQAEHDCEPAPTMVAPARSGLVGSSSKATTANTLIIRTGKLDVEDQPTDLGRSCQPE
ncbi:hypothetical protein MA20_37850 [Bradyrhizobium japonicum]|uniref:Uncharacterized protein n=1 Tax=Bradyrhizobium japonicum TaxID=375 RepID=A0A0A3YLK3_BRAJP|nr:hypothetical protein MA20_37850 [Bradyrhizobium japonicum]